MTTKQHQGIYWVLTHAMLDASNSVRHKDFVEYMINGLFFTGYFQTQDLRLDERLIALDVEDE